MNIEKIKSVIKKHKKKLREKYKIKEIGIFGSYVREKQKKKSDVDILVKFDKLPGLIKFIEIERYFENFLKRKVDLIEKTSLRPQVKKVILKETIYV